MPRLLPIVLLAAFTPWTHAQTTVASSTHSFVPARPAPPATFSVMRSLPPGSSLAAHQQMRGTHHQSPLLPFGLFPGSLLFDYPLPAELSATPSQPQFNLIEALSALGKTQEPPPPPSQPLLIELQGDRYVRMTNAEMNEGLRDVQDVQTDPHTPLRTAARNSSRTHPTSAAPGSQSISSATIQSTTRELAPVTLIFRDGHSEGVRDYSIVEGVIYARGDYYTDGYWNKKIELTALDLPETLKSNETRGVNFILPKAPNEVVTRP